MYSSPLSPGKSAVNALLSPAYAKLKNVPKLTTETEAQNVLQAINSHAFFLRVQRGPPTGSSSSPKALQIIPQQMFAPDEHYAWFYEGPQWTTYLGGLIMVAVILGGVMFPLWPPIMRLGVWYLSVGMLGLIGLFFALAIVRLIFYVITVIVASPGIWIFPQLFADVGFVRIFLMLFISQSPPHSSFFLGRIIHTVVGVGYPKEKGQEEEGRQGSYQVLPIYQWRGCIHRRDGGLGPISPT